MRPVIPVIPVGPRDVDRLRLVRVIDSIVRCEPDLTTLIVLVDGVTEAELSPLLTPVLRRAGLTVIYLANPRNGRGNGAFDGLAWGLTAAYAFVAHQHPGAHVWKIDTDALVLRRTSDQIADYFAGHPGVGMAGTYLRNADGSSRQTEHAWWETFSRRYRRPIWYWWSTNRITSCWFGKCRRFSRMMRQAHAKGLGWGHHVQGGSYALNADLLGRWLAEGRLDHPEAWLGVPLGEDMCFSHWTLLAGFTLGDFNGPGEAFAVRNVGMPMPIERLLAGNYGVVHSLKVGDWAAEEALADALVRRTAPLVEMGR